MSITSLSHHRIKCPYFGPTEGREWRLGGPQQRNARNKFRENRSNVANFAMGLTQTHAKLHKIHEAWLLNQSTVVNLRLLTENR